jgi:Holliday junction resolvasome RuvABC endonuclease subunit
MEAVARGVLAAAVTLKTPGPVLGIDLALRKTGLCIFTRYGSLLRSYTLSYPLARTKPTQSPISEGDRIERLINLTNEIIGHMNDFDVCAVGIEGFAYKASYQAHQMGEIAGVVKTQCWLAKRIIPQIIAPSTGRKAFLGYGSASKAAVSDVLVNRLEFSLNTEHEADAYIVGRCVWDRMARRHSRKKKKA